MPINNKITIRCTVNGEAKRFTTYPMKRLLDLLREEGGLTGTKEGCGEGECGACSILLNDKIVNSCLVPALQADGAVLTTIEGIADDKKLRTLQEAFVEHGGSQCGICTPGMILAAVALLQKHSNPTEDQMRKGLAGNLCRCTGYMKIFAAILAAAAKMGTTK